MRVNFGNLKNKRQLESILLICALVAMSIVVFIPMTAPKAQAVTHLAGAAAEDGNPLYDFDMVPGQNGYVLWDVNDDHIISDPLSYTVELGMTLEIPNLNYQLGNPAENTIEFQGAGTRIEVWGTLITNLGPAFQEWTSFSGGGFMGWDGIYFRPGSSGNLLDVRIDNSQNGVVWEPGSTLLFEGIEGCRFENIKTSGMQMNGVTGSTNIVDTDFYRRAGGPPVANGMGLDIANGQLNISDSTFNSHGLGLSSLHIVNATVNVDNVVFEGFNQPGYSVFVEESGSDDTEIHNSDFSLGVADNHYIRTDGASILVNSSTFDTTGGQLSVIANDLGIPANAILRNPNPPGTTFDNTTMNVTGGSSITLQWFKDVLAQDPDGNFIINAPVVIKDRLGNPSQPPTQPTDATGWARWFIVTELIQYQGSTTNFNPFNISAENDSMLGYAIPEETMNMSKVNTIIVPFNPIANTPPSIFSINLVPPPPAVQSGLVTITFELFDPNAADNGNLSVEVKFFDPGTGWFSVVLDPMSDSLIDLNVSTLYTLYWVSNDPTQLPNYYSTGVLIQITPYDKGGPGTPSEIGPFTLDNQAPWIMTDPTVEVTDTNAWVNWTTNENAEAQVFYGFTLLSPVFTTEVTGNSGTTLQSVQLTGLQPGRNYTYVINSTDPEGNKRSQDPMVPTFKTEIRIQLVKGWNMVSIPPDQLGITITDMLANIAGQYDAVQVYDAQNLTGDYWKHYNPGKRSDLNDLTSVNLIQGFWILMKNDALLIANHLDPTTTLLFSGSTAVNLVAGWNFVVYPSVVDRLIGPALTGFTYDIVWAFDGTQWEFYDGSPGSTLLQVELGMGYWIHCPFPGTWNVAYV